MLISELVHPWLVGVFLVSTFAAALVHRISGSNQKITLTFLVIVMVALWLGNEPWAEPFPGAIRITVILATVLQITMAGAAYWVRDPKPTV